jgi:hypothetical protein
MNNKLALFKAKYGASNRMMAALLNVEVKDIRSWVSNDSTPCDKEIGIERMDSFIKRIINEGELLGSQAPYIQVLEHTNQLVHAENERLSKKLEVAELKTYKPIKPYTLWDKVKIWLSPERHGHD